MGKEDNGKFIGGYAFCDCYIA